MISFTTISDVFTLDLEENFSQLFSAYISAKECDGPLAWHKQSVLEELGKKRIPLIRFNELLAGLPQHHTDGLMRERWEGVAGGGFLKKSEQLSLTHRLAADYDLLTIMFNQFAANNMYKVAWAYIAEDAGRKYGAMLIERQRECQAAEENAVYEFGAFVFDKSQDCITHACHQVDHFAIAKNLRLNLVFEGFRKTGALIEACRNNPEKLLTFKIKNIYSTIINPLYKFFQDLPAPGAKLP